jgi:hypothetical protein
MAGAVERRAGHRVAGAVVAKKAAPVDQLANRIK